MRSYKKLLIWQRADILAKDVYSITRDFPRYEIYGLTSQVRRSALSIPLNIIEGYSRQSKKTLRNYLSIAYSSLVETEYLIEFAYHLKYIKKIEFNQINNQISELGKMIWTFRNRI
jgi:four helix bundle protein